MATTGRKSSTGGQRKPVQHETVGPGRPRRGQCAGLNHIGVSNGATQITAKWVQRGLTEGMACNGDHVVRQVPAHRRRH